MEHGSYDALFGSAEPEGSRGAPQVFVIGGGGSGIPVYRRLQRMDVPFAAGVLHENDLDLPVARALACAVIVERAFEPVSPAREAEAMDLLRQCRAVLCPLDRFGTMNRATRTLRDWADAQGKLMTITDLER